MTRTVKKEKAMIPLYIRGDGWSCYRASDLPAAMVQSAPLHHGEDVHFPPPVDPVEPK